MGKSMKRVLTLVLTFSLLLSMLVVSVSAKEARIDKTAEWADDAKQIADVTLSVPGDVKIQGADIVFVIDKSSCGKYATAQFKEMFEELAAAQKQSGATIKVGVVVFNYTDHLDVPLTELTSENVDELLGMIGSYSGGTNMESGLLTAKKMLDADDSVAAENKHVILISDGYTWAYDDENGDATTILWKNGNGSVGSGTQGYSSTRGVSGYQIPSGYTWASYWAQIQAWVEADGNAYDYNIADYDQSSTDAWKAKLQSEGAAVALTFAEGQNHAVNMDRAMYDAWKAFTALQNAGYSCYVNSVNTSSESIGYHFMNMLAGEQKPVDFESIKNTIIYYVSKGSYVKDVIGYGDNYNFDFITDPETITLTVAEVKYNTTKLETAKEGFDASYEFTAPGAAEATFTLDYVKGNGTSEEMFIWTFGEDLSAFYPAKLDYQVELVSIVNNPAEAKAVVDTNKSATLYPKDSDGNEGTPEEFPVPQLNIPKYKVSYVYTGVVPSAAPAAPSTKYYFAGDKVYTEGSDAYKVTNYIFNGWNDPCNDLADGIMPAHDVTLIGSYIPVNENVDPPIGIKTDKETTGIDYEVTIAVPGDGEAVKVHDEVILILDGSYSVDNEWPKMKENIMQIARKVLGGASRTEMTIIAFGMGDNIVMKGVKTASEVEAKLDAMPLPGNLLYGRSSTNCEAGFAAALKYIQARKDVLADVDVLFISDGGVNTDEHEDIFDDYTQNWLASKSELAVAEYARTALLTWTSGSQPYNSVDYIIKGWAKPSPAFTKVFGGMSAAEVKAMYLDDSYEEFKANYKIYLEWADEVYAEVYKAAGLTRGAKYPISVVERAFVSYDKENGTRIQDLFYANLKGRGYSNRVNRTVAAANELAACALVDELYLIRYGNHGSGYWVKDVEGGKNYYRAESISGLLDVVGPLTEELSKTNYTNVVVTDYMSKWVLLHTDSISIKNDTTGETIWTIKDGWAEGVEKPTAKEAPVVVELVAPEDYDKGGADVIGNTNGDIYKLTWYVKDDCLLRTDNYSLHYDVTVDIEEEGFVFGVEYPANGNTYVDFEENGHNDIEVPNVSVPAYTVTYIDSNGNIVVRQVTNLTTGTGIPGCESPADYTEDGLTYKFKGWTLISGVEGENNTIGTTNLVYLSVYEVEEPTHEPVRTLGSIVVIKNTTGAETPDEATFQLQKMEGNERTNVGEAVAYSAFVGGAYSFAELEEGTYRVVESNAEVEGYTLETTYSENVVLTETVAENGDITVSSGSISVTNAYEEELIEIPDEEPPLADVPKTGDLILPFIGMAIVSGMGAIFVGKKKEEEE